MTHQLLVADVLARVEEIRDEAIEVRRDLHAHPELGWHEVRTTEVLERKLIEAGLSPRVLPTGTGLICDIGSGDSCVALRADIDALPVTDAVEAPWRSTVDGVAHACGHDVHTAALLGAGLVLAGMARDGRLDGQVGLRVGALTAAADRILVRLTGPGGHTSRPHLTGDLVYALATLVTELPAALSRRIDPRAGMSLVWGRITSGSTANAIPARGEAEGTLRCLDVDAWRLAAELIPDLASQLVAPYGVEVDTEVTHGVPPVMNDAGAVDVLHNAVQQTFGPSAITTTDQSLGGEDFAWYLEHVPGAMARLGVRPPALDTTGDLHTPTFDPSEESIPLGTTLLTSTALLD